MAPSPEDGPAPDLAGVSALVLGCGAVGSSFAAALGRAGAELTLWSRDAARASALAEALGATSVARAGAEGTALPDLAPHALVLVTVTDDALEPFVAALAAEPARRAVRDGALFHTNGTRGYEVLAPLAGRGWALGKLHPLRALAPARRDGAADLRGTWFAVSCEPDARAWTARVVEGLGGHALPLGDDAQASARLHTAASLLSGGLVALFDAALVTAGPAAGADAAPSALRDALLALVASTADNLAGGPPEAVLTGPVARGAADTVQRQLALCDEETRALYRWLGRRMLLLADRRGGLDPAARQALGALFA